MSVVVVWVQGCGVVQCGDWVLVMVCCSLGCHVGGGVVGSCWVELFDLGVCCMC